MQDILVPKSQNKFNGKTKTIGDRLSQTARTKVPTLNKKLSPAKPTKLWNEYWKLAAKRQELFFDSVKGGQSTCVTDPILNEYKFTNAYRASDRVSQYLIKHVIYDGDFNNDDLFYRIMIFKTFNKISTWKLIEAQLGEITWSTYDFDKIDSILSNEMASKRSIYSAAYIMASGKTFFGHNRKHSNHLRLIQRMLDDEVPSQISNMNSMREVFELLRSYPTIGDFLAFQYVIDINYSPLTNFSEMDFVVAGPGAKDGIRKCFSDLGGLTEVELIKWVADIQKSEFDRLGIHFKDLWGRQLQLIDCQNLFCEIDKYARVAYPELKGYSNRTRIKQRYRPNPERIDYFYPPKWKLRGVEGFLEK